MCLCVLCSMISGHFQVQLIEVPTYTASSFEESFQWKNCMMLVTPMMDCFGSLDVTLLEILMADCCGNRLSMVAFQWWWHSNGGGILIVDCCVAVVVRPGISNELLWWPSDVSLWCLQILSSILMWNKLNIMLHSISKITLNVLGSIKLQNLFCWMKNALHHTSRFGLTLFRISNVNNPKSTHSLLILAKSTHGPQKCFLVIIMLRLLPTCSIILWSLKT